MKDKIISFIDTFEVGESLVFATCGKILKSAYIKDARCKIQECLASARLASNIARLQGSAKINVAAFLEDTLLAVIFLNALQSSICNAVREKHKLAKEQALKHRMVDCWSEVLQIKCAIAFAIAEIESFPAEHTTSYFLSRLWAVKESICHTAGTLALSAGRELGFAHVAGIVDAVTKLASNPDWAALEEVHWERLAGFK